MKTIQQKVFLIVLIGLLCFEGCSPRYISYKRAVRKVKNDEMTDEEFDKKFYTLFKPGQILSSDTTFPLKFHGSYVNQDTDGKYIVLKFLPDGKVFIYFKMDTYPNNISVLQNNKLEYYYRVEEEKVEIEYLLVRDWSLFNIIMTGEIKNDSIVFYQRDNQRFSLRKPKRIHSVYVYDIGLTVTY